MRMGWGSPGEGQRRLLGSEPWLGIPAIFSASILTWVCAHLLHASFLSFHHSSSPDVH